MKILYIATNFTALTHTFITREISELRRAGHTIALLSLRTHVGEQGADEPECDLDGCRFVYPLSGGELTAGLARACAASPARVARAASLLARSSGDSLRTRSKLLYQLAAAACHAPWVAGQGIEHIHAHFASSPATFALDLHLLTGIPFSFTGHAADIFREPSALKLKLERAAGVVAISDYNRRHYRSLVPDIRRIEPVHCGIDVNRHVFRHRAAAGSPLRILAIGRCVEKKGFADLVAALALLQRRGVPWTCDLVGEGPLLPALREQAAALSLDGLHCRGALQQGAILELLDAADAFVLPCVVAADGDRDNIPVSLMEAMACGCPVVSTDVAGIPELIGDDGQYGLLVPQRSPESVCDALARLAAEPELCSRLSQAGRHRIETEFNLERTAGLLDAFFCDLTRSAR